MPGFVTVTGVIYSSNVIRLEVCESHWREITIACSLAKLPIISAVFRIIGDAGMRAEIPNDKKQVRNKKKEMDWKLGLCYVSNIIFFIQIAGSFINNIRRMVAICRMQSAAICIVVEVDMWGLFYNSSMYCIWKKTDNFFTDRGLKILSKVIRNLKKKKCLSYF